MRQTTTEALDRLLTAAAGAPTECWEWLGSLNSAGYGRIRADGVEWLAHRFAYTHLVKTIPDGMVIDHLCRNRICVNPAHLEVVTSKINTLRGESFAAKNAVASACIRGHEFTAANTRITASTGHRQCRTCRRDFNKRFRATRALTVGP